MRVRPVVGAVLVLAALVAVALLSPSCGKSASAKAYEAYNAKVEPLLDRDRLLWKKLLTTYNEQIREANADPATFEECVVKEAIPFYDDFVVKVEAAKPSEPGLLEAHEALTKLGGARVRWTRFVADNLDVFRPDAGAQALARRQEAAETAVQEYQKLTEGPSGVQDPRFVELRAVKDDFAERGMRPFNEGKMTQQELADYIRKNILTRVKQLRSGKFADTEEGRLLREAIGTSEDLYAAVAEHLPSIDRNQRFGGEAARRTKETDDLFQKFLDAMAAARRRG